MKRLSKQEMKEVMGGNPPQCYVNCLYSPQISCGCYGQGTCVRDPYGLNNIVCDCEGTIIDKPCGFGGVE